MRVILAIVVWLSYQSVCHGYRILGVFPFPGKSHFVMNEQVMKGLARKGHQVDVISTFPLKKPYPNYNDIVNLVPNVNLVNNLTYEFMQAVLSTNPVYIISTLGGNDVCSATFKNPEIQNLLRNPPKDPPYDAVIVEVFGSPCTGIFAHLLNVPLIGISTTSLYPWLSSQIAQPGNVAFVSNNLMGVVGHMNFWQRVQNFLQPMYTRLFFYYLTSPQDAMIREYFGPNMPGVRELEASMAMILLNSHISLNEIEPRTPAVVDVAGIHIQDDNSPLQPELEKWLNDSTDGLVYFTFGSMVMIETFPQKFLDILYASLGKIAPVRVLMKVPSPEKLPPGLPENIYTSPWMPQITILKHPNTKAFITHGGLMGTQEAVASGVPMIGMPLFADQFLNIDTYVSKNNAVKLDIKTMTEKDMDAALNAILRDPVYKESARNLSRRFLDRPLNALDTANYWVEYVIKYGSNALRSPAMDLPWWQLCSLDVTIFLLTCVAIFIIIVTSIVRFLLEMISGNYDSTLQSKKTR